MEIKTFLNNPCIKKEVWREIRYFEPKDNKIQHIKICGMELKQFKRKQKMKKSFLAHVMSPVLYPDIETKIEQKKKTTTNILHRYRCKNPQQSISKSNTEVYKKN